MKGERCDGIIIMMEPVRKPLVEWFLEHKTARTFIFEFFACVFLTFMCLSTVLLPPFEDHPHDPNIYHMVYVALIVYSIICFAGPISGAHINPAVTLSYFSSKKKEKGDLQLAFAYVVAQLTGCTLGCILSKQFFDIGEPVYLVFPDPLELMKDCAEEFTGTFLLIMFIFILNNEETTFVHSEAWGHLLIGLVYYFCLTFATHFHYLNPAIVFSFQFAGMMSTQVETNTLLACLFLSLAQLLGAWLSQFVFTRFYLKQARFWKEQFK